MGTREDYQSVMEQQLNMWKTQGEQFKAGMQQMEEQARAQFEKNLELLHAKQEEAWANFYKLKNASESAWGQMRTNMEKASGELKVAAERMNPKAKG